ncbi:hypothetical protein [Xanthocytophaga flavus]|uniref:hypothetical protein n=1 Tax=Xanthocytophaga flava TaxID=3048013 RepID=UPI0028D5A482|nr:hypothetical protein [Xanthocytophaga flavus]
MLSIIHYLLTIAYTHPLIREATQKVTYITDIFRQRLFLIALTYTTVTDHLFLGIGSQTNNYNFVQPYVVAQSFTETIIERNIPLPGTDED